MREIIDREVLPKVSKPSRYLGTEHNSTHKDPESVDVRIALAFPDLYDLGLSNLGLLILYSILNHQDWIWAERVYAPDIDMEEELRKRHLPLFSLESRTPLKEFDAVGFTLQYELSYTNILNMLSMSDIPLRTENRRGDDPVIIAGGPCGFNPEPLAYFIDAFVLGDGEDVILEVARALKETKGAPHRERIRRLGEIGGIYVPSLHKMVPAPDGTIVPPPGAGKIVKRTVKDLNKTPFPTDYIVPFTQQVFDRVSLEVLRGCTQACRFCQAGMIYRPVRERTIDNLKGIVKEVIAKTGYDEVTLSSLSTCDYSRVRELVHEITDTVTPMRTSVALPSIRLDSFSVDLAEMAGHLKKPGLTFAPEAASTRLRAVIDKPVTDENLMETTGHVYAKGWDQVKLYFMIGLPTETEEDVRGIADLAKRVLDGGRAVNRRARVNAGVSTFVPKPHTPFQWDEQISLEETQEKQRLLYSLTRGTRIKLSTHNPFASHLEGIISRGDRRVGDLIEEAYRLGCRFDGWDEHLDTSKWHRAFENWGLDPNAYLRQRDLSEELPWNHIDSLVEKDYFVNEYIKSRQAHTTLDCRNEKCHQCGVISVEKEGCLTMLRDNHKGRPLDKELELPKLPEFVEPEAVQKIRFKFAKSGNMRFLSHLELVNAIIRAMRRSQLPISYSQGFSPRPKLSPGYALPVGVESEGEYVDVTLHQQMQPDEFKERLSSVMPEGLDLITSAEVELKSPSLMSHISAESYHTYLADMPQYASTLNERTATLMAGDELWVERKNKKGRIRKINLRPLIKELLANSDSEDKSIALDMMLLYQEGSKPNPEEIIRFLLPEVEAENWSICKLESFVDLDGHLVDPLQMAKEEEVYATI